MSKRFLVNHRTSGNIDQNRTGLHLSNAFLVEKMERLVRKGHCSDNVIAFFEELFHRNALHAVSRIISRIRMTTEINYFHPERHCAFCHFCSDAAKTDEP